jgi:16S rRNA U516 pseudouridylate synthase RsuA-like enzyme
MKRGDRVVVRVTEGEARELRKRARFEGLSVSSLVRRALGMVYGVTRGESPGSVPDVTRRA